MKKTLKILLIFVLPVILIMTIGAYVFITNTDRLPYKNYTDFSTSSGYIYSRVSYCKTVNMVVMPNNWYYEAVKNYLYHDKYNSFFYVAKIGLSNFLGIPISINKELNDKIKSDFIEPELVSRYESVDITKENYIKGNVFQDSLNWPNKKALVYLLLKKGIRNCSNDCETGEILISKL